MKEWALIWLLLALFAPRTSFSQTYFSTWSERGISNKLDSVLIEVDGRKIKFELPGMYGFPLVFEGLLDHDIDSSPQHFAVETKITTSVGVTPEFQRLLQTHSPVLMGDVRKDANSALKFSNDMIVFRVPDKTATGLERGKWPTVPRNYFHVDRVWTIKSRPWAMRNLLEYDSYYGTGLVCGLIDGLLEDLKMVMAISEFVGHNKYLFIGDTHLYDLAVSQVDSTYVKEYGFLLPRQFTSSEAVAARAEYRRIAMEIGKFAAKYNILRQGPLVPDAEMIQLFETVFKQMSESLKLWFEEFSGDGTTAIAAYHHGKILYQVATMFVGIREVSLLLQGGREAAAMARTISEMMCFTDHTLISTNHGRISIKQLNLGH